MPTKRQRTVPSLGTRQPGQCPKIAAVKPDAETNPLVDLDCEKVPTWDQHAPQATPVRANTCE